ncbi:MAG: arsenite methyltransferase [Bacteroidota bacterium]
MTADPIKTAVVDGYARIARASQSAPFAELFACCTPGDAAPTDTARRVAQTVGYTEADLDAAPEGSNLGVGCGNPVALSRIEAGDTVLDLGSGAGFDCFLAAQHVGASGRVIGVDLGDEMLALARKNAEACGLDNVTFVQGDIEDVPLESDSVDRVISNCVINLAPDKPRVFAEAHRVLRDGGSFHISDIVLTGEIPDEIRNSEAGLIACISGAARLDDYLQYAEAAGFTDVRVDTETDFPLELILTDPVAQRVLADLRLNAEQVEEIRSSVKSISMSGTKGETG